MKTLLSRASVLLLIAAPLHAQKPVVELPELQEWYSWSGAEGSYISYLPNFDTANGGVNAITQKRKGDPTWYNRFAYDTVNQFSWNGGSWSVVQLDLNGDGVSDYFDGEGRVYPGIKKGMPPAPALNVIYDRGGDHPFVGDFNGDGYEDMLTVTIQAQTFKIIFGGKDLLHLRSAIVGMPPFAFALWTGIAAYVNNSGKGRFISYRSDSFSEGFYLFDLIFENSPGDSIKVSIKELSSVVENKTNKTDELFYPTQSGLYSYHSEHTFILSAKNENTRIYSLLNDQFDLQTIKKISTGPLYFLRGSIDGDSVPDIASVILYNNTPRICIFSGSPITGFEPRALLTNGLCGFESGIYYIGDVTGDGIGDIAIGMQGCFSIYKGAKLDAVKVDEVTSLPKNTLRQVEPNPVGKEGTFAFTISIERIGHYTVDLYDLTGKRLGELFSGELPPGESRLPLNVSSYLLPSGMYTLRLSDGKQTRERAFSLTH
ncbi:MAG: T9SS type A sorting domain-containing protein [Ignavibacteriae bacterium]|nr:T9SS type A sorting domain-containing protein [Ignavibacteriota bacterium]